MSELNANSTLRIAEIRQNLKKDIQIKNNPDKAQDYYLEKLAEVILPENKKIDIFS